MKRILFLIVLFAFQLFAETWKESGIFHGWENRYTSHKVYFSKSTERTLKDVDYEEKIQSLYFVFFFDNLPGGARFLKLQNDGYESNDSIWISKYWMDDSLVNASVVAEKNLNLGDFRLLKIDSAQSFKISSIMDRRIKVPGDTARLRFFKSLYFVYKKDSSYFAYCAVATGDPINCDFLLSCVYQNDGTLNFGEVPSIDGVFDMDGCPTSALPPSRNLRTKEKEVLPSYNANGKPASDISYGVTLQKGFSKLNLKK